MRRRWNRHTFFLWMAGFAVLFAALAPTVSAALQGADVSGWGEVCTAQASQWNGAGPDSQKRELPPTSIHIFEHCPYCSIHASGMGMPPSGLLLSAISLSHAKQSYDVQTAPSRRLWSYALLRGPPQLS
jgi:Protein of unknown function (DUF2946)